MFVLKFFFVAAQLTVRARYNQVKGAGGGYPKITHSSSNAAQRVPALDSHQPFLPLARS